MDYIFTKRIISQHGVETTAEDLLIYFLKLTKKYVNSFNLKIFPLFLLIQVILYTLKDSFCQCPFMHNENIFRSFRENGQQLNIIIIYLTKIDREYNSCYKLLIRNTIKINIQIKGIPVRANRMFVLLFLMLSLSYFAFTGGQKEGADRDATLQAPSSRTGTIIFTANGEDFVRKGFIDKQGWSISFDRLYINLLDPTAYMSSGQSAVLKGAYWVDLAAGHDEAEPVEIGRLSEIPAENYQGLKFKIRKKSSGTFKDCSMVLIGRAEKKDLSVPFIIRLEEEMDFNGSEGYVGEELKGTLLPGKVTSVEMTFHFDHIFGNLEAAADDHINAGSVGFDFFNRFARNGKVDLCQSEMKKAAFYNTLIRAIWTLGHLGEGHCDVANQSSAGELINDQ